MAKSRDKAGREAKKPKADKKVAAPPGGFPRTQPPPPPPPPKAKPAK